MTIPGGPGMSSTRESQRTPVLLVLVLWATGLGAAAQFAKVSVPFSAFQAAYPSAGTELGFLVSLISLLGIFFGLFAGLIVSRGNPYHLLLGAVLLGALMSVLQASR